MCVSISLYVQLHQFLFLLEPRAFGTPRFLLLKIHEWTIPVDQLNYESSRQTSMSRPMQRLSSRSNGYKGIICNQILIIGETSESDAYYTAMWYILLA